MKKSHIVMLAAAGTIVLLAACGGSASSTTTAAPAAETTAAASTEAAETTAAATTAAETSAAPASEAETKEAETTEEETKDAETTAAEAKAADAKKTGSEGARSGEITPAEGKSLTEGTPDTNELWSIVDYWYANGDTSLGYLLFNVDNTCVLSIRIPQNRKEKSPFSDWEFPIIRKRHAGSSSWALPRPAPRRGGRKAACAAFARQGDPCRLCQGLPGRFASSVLSLDTAPAPG